MSEGIGKVMPPEGIIGLETAVMETPDGRRFRAKVVVRHMGKIFTRITVGETPGEAKQIAYGLLHADIDAWAGG